MTLGCFFSISIQHFSAMLIWNMGDPWYYLRMSILFPDPLLVETTPPVEVEIPCGALATGPSPFLKVSSLSPSRLSPDEEIRIPFKICGSVVAVCILEASVKTDSKTWVSPDHDDDKRRSKISCRKGPNQDPLRNTPREASFKRSNFMIPKKTFPKLCQSANIFVSPITWSLVDKSVLNDDERYLASKLYFFNCILQYSIVVLARGSLY